ncbi:MAG: hypothetical protein P4K98_09755 [Bryobacteraceae bacterium]|nr:hypothetical protein [Bryobacteraceae bacterium]
MELIITLQADISALEQMMLEANPEMAAQHRALTEKFRNDFLKARRDKLREEKRPD